MIRKNIKYSVTITEILTDWRIWGDGMERDTLAIVGKLLVVKLR